MAEGADTETLVVFWTWASNKVWGKMQVHLQLLEPWLLACSTVAAEPCYRCMAVEANISSQARGTQGHSWWSYLQVSPVVQTNDRRQNGFCIHKELWWLWLLVCTSIAKG